ncbi:MAG: hypothetical protein K2R98_14835 [Gemmataceae bacterium]|nr:hypothetical protein [Gemmataceae bacterium]
MAAHLRVERYGDFWLTQAVRPSLDLQVVPRQGYRIDTYRDSGHRLEVPVLAAAVSRENLFDAFLSLLEPLGEVVDVVLETSHQSDSGKHQDLVREAIDQPVLTSHFCDFEDLLLHDGCTGVAVMSTTEPMEVQFDEHKLLIVYAQDLRPFARCLRELGVRHDNTVKLITEGEHMHNSDVAQSEQFQQLCYRLGVGEAAERVSW